MRAKQFSLDFEAGLTQRYPRWEDTLVNAVYASRMGLNGVAAKLDMSPSELSKRLSHHTDEPRPIRSQDIVGIIEATGDFTPIHWLVEKFLQDPELKSRAALAMVPLLVEQMQATLQAIDGKKIKSK